MTTSGLWCVIFDVTSAKKVSHFALVYDGGGMGIVRLFVWGVLLSVRCRSGPVFYWKFRVLRLLWKCWDMNEQQLYLASKTGLCWFARRRNKAKAQVYGSSSKTRIWGLFGATGCMVV